MSFKRFHIFLEWFVMWSLVFWSSRFCLDVPRKRFTRFWMSQLPENDSNLDTTFERHNGFFYVFSCPPRLSVRARPTPPAWYIYIYIYIHRYFSQLVSRHFKLDFTTSWVRKRRRNTFGEFFWFASVCKTSSLKKQVWHESFNFPIEVMSYQKDPPLQTYTYSRIVQNTP